MRFLSLAVFVTAVGPAVAGELHRPQPLLAFPSNDVSPALADDPSYLVYSSDETGNMDVWFRNQRTGARAIVGAHPADDFEPTISGDAERIAFVSRRQDAKGDIYWVDRDGGEPERLTFSDSADRRPRFAPDGRAIYYLRQVTDRPSHIARLDLETRAVTVASPNSAIDFALSKDGSHLVYVRPRAGAQPPRLVARKLIDGQERLISESGVPEGFPVFINARSIAFARYLDDDNQDGLRDAADRASVWRLDLDLALLFADAELSEPYPLTTGALGARPAAAGGGILLIVASPEGNSDVFQISDTGLFPDGLSGAEYGDLARRMPFVRDGWFALRYALAMTPAGSDDRKRLRLRLARGHRATDRPDLARLALGPLLQDGSDDQYAILGAIELIGLNDGRPDVEDAIRSLDTLGQSLGQNPEAAGRASSEKARLFERLGQFEAALKILDQLVDNPQVSAELRAAAARRRVEILGHPASVDSVVAVFSKLLRRMQGDPRAQELLAAACVERLGTGVETRARRLRRALTHSEAPVLRIVLRSALARGLDAANALGAAAAEYRALQVEAERFGMVAALREAQLGAAMVALKMGRRGDALDAFIRLRRAMDTPDHVVRQVRRFLGRIALEEARNADVAGEGRRARLAYQEVLAVDPGHAYALRRLLAVQQRLGEAEAERDRREAARDAMPNSAEARYAYALALAWEDPPNLSDALAEVDAAVELNPQLVGPFLLRGWLYEALEFERPGGAALERAIDDYQVALRLNAAKADTLTEADIVLNLGNAHWRLARKAKDTGGNARAALNYFGDRLAMPVAFPNNIAETIFLERMGRAALWLGDSQRAIAVTQKAIKQQQEAGQTSRLSQLYGNLALAYSLAGKSGEASSAFSEFETRMRQTGGPQCLSIAARNQVLESLKGGVLHQDKELVGMLEVLKRGREPEAQCPELENRVSLGSAPTSRAPLGFSSNEEMALNLSLAARIHRRRGQYRRADRLESRRAELVYDHIARREDRANRNAFLKLFDDLPEHVAISVLREYVGLRLLEIQRAPLPGDIEAQLRDIRDFIRERRNAGIYALRRLDALEVELAARTLVVLIERGPAFEDVRSQTHRRLERVLGNFLGARTAKALPLSERKVVARAEHALGQMRLSELPEVQDLGSGLERLDLRLAAVAALVAGRQALNDDTSVLDKTLQVSIAAARSQTASVSESRRSVDIARQHMPEPFGPTQDAETLRPGAARAVGTLSWRAARRAIGRGDGAEALVFYERALRSEDARHPPQVGQRPEDQKVVAAVQAARHADDQEALLRSLQRPISAALKARLGSGPAVADIVGGFDDGEVFVLLADGPQGRPVAVLARTDEDTGEPQYDVLPLLDAQTADLVALQRLRPGPVPGDLSAAIEARWLKPIEAALLDAERVYLCDRPLGQWFPANALRVPAAVTKVSSLAALAALKESQMSGGQQTLHVGGRQDEGTLWIGGEEMRAVAQTYDGPPSERPRAHLLRHRFFERLILDSPMIFEGGVPGRSALRIRAAANDADAFAAEVTLDSMRMQGERLIVTALDARPRDQHAVSRLDLLAAQVGAHAVAVFPQALPRRFVANTLRQSAFVSGSARQWAELLQGEQRRWGPSVWVDIMGVDPRPDSPARRMKRLRRGVGKWFRAKQSEAAVPSLREWIRLAKASNDTRGLRLASNLLVRAHLGAGRYAEAVDVQADLVIGLEDSPRRLRASAESELGYLLSRAGEGAVAVEMLDRALRGYIAIEDLLGQANVQVRVAQHYRRRLEFEFAADAYRRALEVFRQAGTLVEDSERGDSARLTLRNLGAVLLNRLNRPAAADLVFSELEMVEPSGLGRFRARISRARAARREGRFVAAAEWVRGALAGLDEQQTADLRVDATIELANIAWKQGDYVAGRQHCAAAKRQAERALNRERSRETISRVIFAASVCGLVKMSNRDFEDAEIELQEAARLAQSAGLESELAAQKNNLGRLFFESGQYAQAVDAFREAETIDRRLADERGLGYDRRNLGVVYREIGDARALGLLEAALKHSRNARDRGNEAVTLVELADTKQIGNEARNLRYLDEAIEIARADNIKTVLARALRLRAQRSSGADREAGLRDAFEVAQEIRGTLRIADHGAGRYAAAELLIEDFVAQGRYGEAWALAEQLRCLRQGRAGCRPTAADPKLVPRGMALLSVTVTESAVVSMVLDGAGVAAARTPVSRAHLRAVVRLLNRGLDAGFDIETELGAIAALTVGPHQDRLLRVARLQLFTDDVMRYVPFAALPVGAGRLGERLSITMGHGQAQVAAPTREDNAASVFVFVPTSADRAGLPLAGIEASLIAEIYPRAILRTGVDATRDAFLAALSKSGAIVHYAGHGVNRGGERGLEFHDGIVGWQALASHRIAASMVTLSSCAVGATAPSADGAELASILGVLHGSGVRRVVLSAHRVEDLTAAAFMKHFYRELKTAPAADAMRGAQHTLRDQSPDVGWWGRFMLSESSERRGARLTTDSID